MMTAIYKKSQRIFSLQPFFREFPPSKKKHFFILLILTGIFFFNQLHANTFKLQDDIEYKTGDFLADKSGSWNDPMIWRQFDGDQFGAYGAAGVPDPENSAYIIGTADLKTIITCNSNNEINNLTLLSYADINLIQNTPAFIFSILGNFTSLENTLINSASVQNYFELKGEDIQYLDLSGSIGTNTHLVISGVEIRLGNTLNLTFPSSAIQINGGTLNFNDNNVIGEGRFELNSGTLKITSPDGVNPLNIPDEADPSFVNRGNVQNLKSRVFNQSATYWYLGNVEQITGYAFGDGATEKKIIIDNPNIVRLSKSTRISAGGKLELIQGIFEESNTAHIRGTGMLTMQNQTTYRSSILNVDFPQLTNATFLSGSTIELNADEGDQRLKGNIPYQNITFSGGGIKRISSATVNIAGTVSIKDNAILDVENKAFGGETTNFTMTGGVYRTSKLNDAQPGMGGNYNLSGGTVEFYGTTNNNSQTLRGGKSYFNIDITSNEANINVNNVSFGAGIITIAGTFRVLAPSVFQIGGGLGQYITGTGSFILEDDATLIYGNVNGITKAECGQGEECGNIRTVSRTFSSSASYGFVGASDGMISGTGVPTSVKNLYIQRTRPVTLSQDIEVNDKILFSGSGNLITNNKIITLSASGTITETENAHLIGIIRTTRNDNLPSDFGGIGFEFLEAQNNPGLTTITRTTGIPIIGDEGNESILRYFEVQPEGEDINATIRFRYFNGELNDLSEDYLQLFQSDEINGVWKVTGGDVDALQNSIIDENVNDFNFITAASTMSPLPVEIISFKGKIDNEHAILFWSTASEKDNDYFTIEKSGNNIDFQEIGSIPGSGTSSQPVAYSYQDNDFFSSSYYRIKQTDFNGDFTFSDPVFLQKLHKPNFLKIFPNPVLDDVKVSLPFPDINEKKLNIILRDIYGKELISVYELISSFNVILNEKLADLKAGVYIIMIKTSGNIFEARFIRL